MKFSITFKTIIIILLTLILVYVMMTRQIKEPELFKWSLIGKKNYEIMSNLMNTTPILLNKKKNGIAIWTKNQDNKCILNLYSNLKKIELEISNNSDNWLDNVIGNKPIIYIWSFNKINNFNSIKIKEKLYLLILDNINDLKKILKNEIISNQ